MNDGRGKVNKVLLILKKEWLELRQQRVLVLTMILPPLLFALLPVVGVFLVGQFPEISGDKDIKDMQRQPQVKV